MDLYVASFQVLSAVCAPDDRSSTITDGDLDRVGISLLGGVAVSVVDNGNFEAVPVLSVPLAGTTPGGRVIDYRKAVNAVSVEAILASVVVDLEIASEALFVPDHRRAKRYRSVFEVDAAAAGHLAGITRWCGGQRTFLQEHGTVQDRVARVGDCQFHGVGHSRVHRCHTGQNDGQAVHFGVNGPAAILQVVVAIKSRVRSS